jgi:hypothetical protein
MQRKLPPFQINPVSSVKISSLFLNHERSRKSFSGETHLTGRYSLCSALADIALEKVRRVHIHKKGNFELQAVRWSDAYAKRRRLHPFSGDTFIQAIILSAAIYNERDYVGARASKRAGRRL